MMREWIIFALCLGVGGHVALGVVLHAPELWPWSTAGFYGLLRIGHLCGRPRRTRPLEAPPIFEDRRTFIGPVVVGASARAPH